MPDLWDIHFSRASGCKLSDGLIDLFANVRGGSANAAADDSSRPRSIGLIR
jgi:hypothetical protein